MTVKKLLFPSIFTLALLLSGCASKTNTGEEIEGMPAVGSSQDIGEIELNADSDSQQAGALQTIYFDFDSSSLRSEARSVLDANAEFLKTNESISVQIEGHCDERGGIQYNLALGQRRAQSVRDYLIALGIASSRITTISFGKEKPVSFGHDEESWSQNRRGNFVITAK